MRFVFLAILFLSGCSFARSPCDCLRDDVQELRDQVQQLKKAHETFRNAAGRRIVKLEKKGD